MMPKYLQLNPMHDQIESEMEKIRAIVSPHVSKGAMESIKVAREHPAKVETIDDEHVKVEAQAKKLYHAVVALLVLAAIDISLHWIL